MSTVTTIALSDIFAGLLVLGVNIPLILRKVPRNGIYGMRFRASMKSDEAWYAINEYGGKLFAWGSLLILIAGLAGLWWPADKLDEYLWISCGATVLGVFGPALWLYIWQKSVQNR